MNAPARRPAWWRRVGNTLRALKAVDYHLTELRVADTQLRREVEQLRAEAATLRQQADEARRQTEAAARLALAGPLAGLVAEYAAYRATPPPLPDEPLVSVCVATFNKADLLVERCLPSLLAQTYPRLEIIVVGDGCTDHTVERVRALGDPRIVFENLPERGRYPDDPFARWCVAGTAPMNRGLALATGDFVTHLDHDDEHAPTRVAELVAFARETGADVVYHPFEHQGPAGEWHVNLANGFWLGQVTTSSIFYRAWFKRIEWDVEAARLPEPGDWNRFRRFAYLMPVVRRYDRMLLRHYREGTG